MAPQERYMMESKLTLKEAILHCRQKAKDLDNRAKTLWDQKERAYCFDCADEYVQIAHWLEDHQAKLKTGNWIPIDDDPPEDFECDRCGFRIYGYDTDVPKYCAGCGTKMNQPGEEKNE